MDLNKRIYELAFTYLPNMGSVLGRKIISVMGSAKAYFDADEGSVMKESELKVEVAGEAAKREALGRAMRDAEWLEGIHAEVLWFKDSDYPEMLNHHIDSPLILFKKGDLNLNRPRMISVVGSRRATEYGLKYTQKFVRELAPYGVCVVSGLAHGIDARAHRTAMDCGLPTAAVLGHGLEQVYPRNHQGLSEEIAACGALITEFPPGTPMHPSLFPRRNRIIASLSQCVLVMEATGKGGALTTAGFAFDYQRELFALPGTAGLASSEGCNRLIKQQKARLMESVADVIEVMGWTGNAQQGFLESSGMQTALFVDLTEDEQELFSAIQGEKGISMDELARKIGWTMGKINACCTGLELKGAVRSTSAKAYYVDS